MTTGPQHLAAPPESRDDDPLVSTLMATPIVAITPDAPVATALDLMAATGVRHLPVFEGHRCRGLVVEADLIRYLVADAGALAIDHGLAPASEAPRRSGEQLGVLVPDGEDEVVTVARDAQRRRAACSSRACASDSATSRR